MGAQIINRPNHDKMQRILIKKYYHTKLFLKHKKSNIQFQQQIQSISKRAACLEYQWAADLSNFLKINQNNQLYTQYKSILKENCLKEGRKEKIFCYSMIEKSFYESLKAKKEKYSSYISQQQLKQLFQETKAYFMVKQWLNRLTSMNNSKENQQNNNKKIENKTLIQEQWKIFDIMVNLSIQMYKNNYAKEQQVVLKSLKSYKKQQVYSNIQLFKLFKKLDSNIMFLVKQILIQQIQTHLSLNNQNLKQNVEKIIYFFGRQTIFGHLLTIKQLGRINISILWQIFCYDMMNK